MAMNMQMEVPVRRESRQPVPQVEPRLTFQPNVDICDRGTEVVLVADVPGARPDAIDVMFEAVVTSVTGLRRLPGPSCVLKKMPSLPALITRNLPRGVA